jgi:hypothetical protein
MPCALGADGDRREHQAPSADLEAPPMQSQTLGLLLVLSVPVGSVVIAGVGTYFCSPAATCTVRERR